ncbi:MAG: hypothetical protein WC686_02200 [Candidatus Shapirobacteria bacterium]
MQIIPTIFEKELKQAEKRLDKILGLSRWAQIDVVDGIFCPDKTFELELVGTWPQETKILWDVHLMVKEPAKWLNKCIFIGASRIIGQVEMMSARESFVRRIQDVKIEAGLAFDVESPISNVPEDCDLVLIMGRKAGFGEFNFSDTVWEKIETAKKLNRGRLKKFLIAVDGGVDEKNMIKLEKCGVDIVYSGYNYEKLVATRQDGN